MMMDNDTKIEWGEKVATAVRTNIVEQFENLNILIYLLLLAIILVISSILFSMNLDSWWSSHIQIGMKHCTWTELSIALIYSR